MSYFSFTVSKSFFDESFRSKNLKLFEKLKNVQTKQKYYSKYSSIIKAHKNKHISEKVIFIKKEQIKRSVFSEESTIFFLPPKYGLGDVLEYAMAIKIIQEKYPNKKIGLGFIYKYKLILQYLLKLENLYEYYISEEELEKYDSHFHHHHSFLMTSALFSTFFRKMTK